MYSSIHISMYDRGRHVINKFLVSTFSIEAMRPNFHSESEKNRTDLFESIKKWYIKVRYAHVNTMVIFRKENMFYILCAHLRKL